MRLWPRVFALLTPLVLSTSLFAASPTLLKDLDPYPTGGGFMGAVIGTKLIFRAPGPNAGLEPWVSDGTAAGTFMLSDLEPGSTGSNPRDFTFVNTASGPLVFFVATTKIHGAELWKTDGTPQNTAPLNVIPGAVNTFFGFLRAVGPRLVFFTTTEATGAEPFVSDGTPAGTGILKDIRNGTANGVSLGSGIFNVALSPTDPNLLFFGADDGTNGTELWSTRGTPATTLMVADLALGIPGSAPGRFASVPALNKVVFVANDQNSLGIVDGNGANAQIFFTSATAFTFNDLTPISNGFYFTADSGSAGREIFFSNGTSLGTGPRNELIFGAESAFKSLNGIFNRIVPLGLDALIFTDNPAGNLLPALFNLKSGTVTPALISEVSKDNTPQGIQFNNRLYFPARSTTLGDELFVSDGTPAGTNALSDLNPGVAPSSPSLPVIFNGNLFFTADLPEGPGLIKSDGTFQGTSVVTLFEPGTTGSSFPFFDSTRTADLGNKLLFIAVTHDTGSEVFVTDGTSGGTQLVKDVNPGAANFAQLGIFLGHGKGFFSGKTPAAGIEPWVTDGTEAGTRPLKDIVPGFENSMSQNGTDFIEVQNGVVFEANDGVHGAELWVTDGTPEGTNLLKDLSAVQTDGVSNISSDKYLVRNGILYFSGNGEPNSESNFELWKTNGRADGTSLVKEINPGLSASEPRDFTLLGNQIYFVARNNAEGTEIFKTDGTANGTDVAIDLLPGPGSLDPGQLFALNDKLFFSAKTNDNKGTEIYVSDGTTAGTKLLKDINPGPNSSTPFLFFRAGNRVIFSADDGIHGREPWGSDGTPEGTSLLADIASSPSIGSSSLAQVVNTERGAFLNATVFEDGKAFGKLFKTDGTPSGTSEIDPTLRTGFGSLGFFRGKLLFSVNDPVIGDEPFEITLDACPDDPAKTELGTCGCGAPDADQNGNGVLDCFGSQELGLKLNLLKKLSGGVKTPADDTQLKLVRKRIKKIKNLLKEIVEFSNTQAQFVTLTDGDLASRVTALLRATNKVTKFNSEKLDARKKTLKKLIRAFEQSLV